MRRVASRYARQPLAGADPATARDYVRRSFAAQLVTVRRLEEDNIESPFVCDLTAMTAEQRARHAVLAKELQRTVKEIQELPDGYAARFPMEPPMLLLLAEFITLERLCCPCFTLALEAQREHGPLWLRVTGREGVKPFIRAEFGIEPEAA